MENTAAPLALQLWVVVFFKCSMHAGSRKSFHWSISNWVQNCEAVKTSTLHVRKERRYDGSDLNESSSVLY